MGIRGVPRIWQGGAKNFFFRFGNLRVAERHAAPGEAMRFARGVWGHAPTRKFFKMVQFGVYFYHILSLKNYHFLYKRIYILDTRLLWGNNYSCEEIF